MASLDDSQARRRIDPSGLGLRIASLPTQSRDSWVQALAFPLPDSYRRVERILVLGMGGSAIGGALLADLEAFQNGIPVNVHRGYGWPHAVDERTLVIVSSYSGNTEETLSAFDALWKPGVKAIACTRGGKLAMGCGMKGVPVFPIAFEGEPRSALGSSLFALLGFLERLGLGPGRSDEVAATLKDMARVLEELRPEIPLARNAAKQLADRARGKAVVVYGAQHLAAVARRWKTQIAENAKGWAFFEELPEMNHNSIEGVKFPAAFSGQILAVILQSNLYNARVGLRCSLTRDILLESGAKCEAVDARGSGALVQMMMAILVGDWVSYYMAIQNEVDPAAIPNLDRLKARMASR